MVIKVLSVVVEDLGTMRRFVDSIDGQLAYVTADTDMPVDNDEDAARRNNWSLQVQQDCFENDPHVHLMKAVDTDDNDKILGIAHWNYYPAGFVPSKLPYTGLKDMNDDSVCPKGIKISLYKAIIASMVNERNKWTGNGPQWVLTCLKTRTAARRKGAESALVQWGASKAKEDKCPAYLEADPVGYSVYRRNGFEPVGNIPIDLRAHGIDEDPYILTKMIANR